MFFGVNTWISEGCFEMNLSLPIILCFYKAHLKCSRGGNAAGGETTKGVRICGKDAELSDYGQFHLISFSFLCLLFITRIHSAIIKSDQNEKGKDKEHSTRVYGFQLLEARRW